MSSAVRGGLVLLFLFTLLPGSAEAGLFCNRCHKAKRPRHCHSCQKVNCTSCPPPVNCCCCPPVQEMHPVVETRYRQEQVCTPKTVVETLYRNETYCETVPVTRYKCVTVDEGCYQQIWVPKLVQKQVPEVCYTKQVKCRAVPYNVTKCVNEISTRTVPYHTTRYVPCPVVDPCLPGNGGSALPAVSNYPLPPESYSSPTPAPSSDPPSTTVNPPPSTFRAPTPAASYQGPVIGGPTLAPSATRVSPPVPDPRFVDTPEFPITPAPSSQDSYESSYSQPQHVPARSAANEPDLGDFRLPVPTSVAENTEASQPRRYVPAPSAANVWRTPRGTVTR